MFICEAQPYRACVTRAQADLPITVFAKGINGDQHVSGIPCLHQKLDLLLNPPMPVFPSELEVPFFPPINTQRTVRLITQQSHNSLSSG